MPLIMFAITDVVVLWAALPGSKSKNGPFGVESDKFPPGSAFKDYSPTKVDFTTPHSPTSQLGRRQSENG